MKIEKNTVATFHYRLLNTEGVELESSNKNEPMAALIGAYGSVLPAVEEALMAKEEGDKVSITLPPERAYGLKKDDAIQRIPIKHLLTPKKKLKVGQNVKVNTQQGAKDATVVKVGKFNVDIDTNHPLAGQTVTFEIDITEVREAIAEEVSHGHAHGVGGHHH